MQLKQMLAFLLQRQMEAHASEDVKVPAERKVIDDALEEISSNENTDEGNPF